KQNDDQTRNLLSRSLMTWRRLSGQSFVIALQKVFLFVSGQRSSLDKESDETREFGVFGVWAGHRYADRLSRAGRAVTCRIRPALSTAAHAVATVGCFGQFGKVIPAGMTISVPQQDALYT